MNGHGLLAVIDILGVTVTQLQAEVERLRTENAQLHEALEGVPGDQQVENNEQDVPG